MLIFVIIGLALVSVLLALWSLSKQRKEIKEIKNVKKALKKSRVIYTHSSSSL